MANDRWWQIKCKWHIWCTFIYFFCIYFFIFIYLFFFFNFIFKLYKTVLVLPNIKMNPPQVYKLVLEKAKEPEIKLPTSAVSWKKQESSRKTSFSALLTMPKPLTVWITINCGKFWKRWEYQTTWPASWEICMQVRKQQLELDMVQQTGSK